MIPGLTITLHLLPFLRIEVVILKLIINYCLDVQQNFFPTLKKSRISAILYARQGYVFFLSAIWLPLHQLWDIMEGTGSFINFSAARNPVWFGPVTFRIYCTQPAITKLTIETLQQGVKYVHINNKDTRTTPMLLFWYLYC